MKTYTIALLASIACLLSACSSGHEAHSSTGQYATVDKHDHNHENEEQHDHDHDEENCGHNGSETDLSDAIEFSQTQAALVGMETEAVARGDFRRVIKTSGQILPAQGDEVTIVATSNGIVSFPDKSLVEGTPVRTGQSLVRLCAKKLLDGDPFVKVKAEYETALKEYRRAEGLVKDRIISNKDFEQTRLRYETAKNAYHAQSSNATPNGVNITAPINGFVKNKLVSEGEYVTVGQAIATVSQNQRLVLRAEVSERHYKTMKHISGANFRTAYDDEVYQLSDLNGRLLSHGKDVGSETFLIPITFEFDNIGSDFVQGSFVEVYLLGAPQTDVLSVPLASVTEEQGLHFVYIRLDEGHYKKVEVSVGQSDGTRVEILAGLKEGDEVVTNGVYQIKLAATSAVIPHGHSH